MKTRKTILNNPFSGKDCRYKCRKWLVDTVGKGEGGQMEKLAWIYIYIQFSLTVMFDSL